MYQTRIRNGKKKTPKHRVLFEPDDDQKYAIVQEIMGNGRVKVLCDDNKIRMGRIRGSMRKCGNKVLIERGDMVIVAMRDFEDDKVDVIHKYNYDEGTYLAKEGDLPSVIAKAWTSSMDLGNNEADTNNNDQYIVFGHMNDTEERQAASSGGSGSRPATGEIDDGFLDEL